MIISLLWIWIARAHIQSLPEVHGDRDSLMTKWKNVGMSCLASSPRFYQWSHLVHTKLWHRNWERGPRLSLLQKSSKIKTGSHVWLRAWVCKADVTLSPWPCNWPAVGAWRSHSSLCLATESCPTLLHPSGYTPPGFYIRGIFRQEYWSGTSFPPPGDLSDPGIELASLGCPALQADSLPSEPSRKPV